MLQQDINRVIFEFTATQSFHCRYININIAKFQMTKTKSHVTKMMKHFGHMT